ncbi:hypothetical protein FHS16_006318 [Paenibacillus endophyticus]|uniref:Uncharacterized protein n=1 Tax=Paenibacillus endophyticus TaxID=1294268 RepID=A0A7W5CEI5_9BACL|nr:hypothetical protein [Paenibacillus endophyticus]MBB3156196.1 hypothetical protein [Paenibacillus endophyticus]
MMLQLITRRLSIRRLYRETLLAKPIYLIMHGERADWYKEQWERFSLQEGRVSEDEIDAVVAYISERVEALSAYLIGIAPLKREMKKVSFYAEYAELLKRFTIDDFNNENIMLYMFLFNELLLGSTRYINIVKELEKLESRHGL